MSRSRDFRFVLNNYSADEENQLKELEGVRYMVFGHEIAPTTGTPHLQGYVYFNSARSFASMKKINKRIDWRTCDASPEDNRGYCVKDGVDIFEKGECPMSQKAKGDCNKRRWAEILQLSESGNWEKLKEDYPHEYCTNLAKLKLVHNNRSKELEVLDHTVKPHFWYYGPPGSGKSLRARREAPGAYIKDPKTKWWNGYDLEDDVIIDDFDKYQVAQGGDMKRWLDIYPFQAEFKGDQSMIRPKRLIITSNYHPNDIWDDEITQQAIARRCNIVLVGEFNMSNYHSLFNPPK